MRWWEHSALQGIKASSIVHAWWRWERGAKESVYIFSKKAGCFLYFHDRPVPAARTVHCITCMYIDRQTNTNLSMGTACIRGQESESTNEGEEDC